MNKGVFVFWSICIGLTLFRVLSSLQYHAPDISACLKHEVRGFGMVSEEPARTDSGQVFIVDVDTIFISDSSSTKKYSSECGRNVSIRIKTKLYPQFSFGEHISFVGKINKPFNFSSGSGRAFDYKGYLAKDNVFYEMKSAVVEIISSEPDDSRETSLQRGFAASFVSHIFDTISSLLFSLKRGFVANLERALGEPHAALASGLVVGEKAALGKDLLNDFRTVGLIHIVVLSGYNITVVGDALRRVLSFLPRVWGISVGGIGIALFGVLVGGGATVVRSCFMASVALSADLIRREYNVSRALIFAALLMLIQNPMILLHDPSFQLSFLATLGLILFASPIETRLGFIPEKFGMRGIVASTIATQITVSPYILYMMGQISIIGMVVNILVLPFIPVTMLAVFLTGVSGFVSVYISYGFGWLAHALLSYELWIVRHFALMPFASLHVSPFSGWWVVGFYLIVAGVYAIVVHSRSPRTN